MTRNKLTGLAIFSICLATAGAWLFTRAQQAHTETTSGTDSAPHTHTDSKGLDQAARSAHSETHYSATQVLPLHQLQSINSGTSSDIVFNLFNTLKLWISQSAENISLTKTVLLTPSDGSAASKRQRSILYGALSETSRTEAAAALVELAGRAQTEDDYIDIFAMLVGKNHSIPLGDHQLFAGQEIKKAVTTSYAEHNRPKEDGLVSVWERYEKAHGKISTLSDIGSYLHEIKLAEPRFTGRAIKNITDSIKMRAMDLDMPDEWFATREPFFAKSYYEKKQMIEALRTPITIDMVLQEINRYADSEFRYTDKSDDAAVTDIIRRERQREKAIQEMEAMKKDGRWQG